MAALVRLLPLLALCACAFAQYAEERPARYIASDSKPAPTPVPILKQINRHNEDGSYTYGYEAADGSFKIETKLANGEVKGKYGYKDDTGKVREVEYGANKYGFQPSGEGITVAPPTLVDETTRENDQRSGKSQGGYRSSAPAQSIDYDYEEPAPAPPPRPAARPAPQQQYRPAPQQQYRSAPQPQQQYRQAPAPQPQPQQQYRPAAQQSAAPTPPRPAFFSGAAPAPVQQDNFFTPAPQKPRQEQYQPKQSFQPSQQFQQSFAPRNTEVSFPQEPRFAPAQPQYAPQPQFAQQKNSPPFSMLDQLLKEFALPQGGSAPLHDITFGSY